VCCEWFLTFPQVGTPNIEQIRKAKQVLTVLRNWSDLLGQKAKSAVTVVAGN